MNRAGLEGMPGVRWQCQECNRMFDTEQTFRVHEANEHAPAVVPLRVVEAPEPDADMVEMLEGYLTMAKAGQLSFLGVVVAFKDGGAMGKGWVYRHGAQRFTVLGALTMMAHDFAATVCQD